MRHDRAGEGAALVTEELALREVRCDRAAIEHHEWTRCASAAGVYGAGKHVLAGTGLSDEGEGDLRSCNALEEGERLAHRDGRTDDAGETAILRHDSERAAGRAASISASERRLWGSTLATADECSSMGEVYNSAIRRPSVTFGRTHCV